MVESDEPTLIQGKRRKYPKHVESVSEICEFLGALIIDKSKKGIFVSTADHYSNTTSKTIATILKEDVVTKFELINYKRFAEMLHLTKIENKYPWEKLIE